MNESRIYGKIARYCPRFRNRYDEMSNLAEQAGAQDKELSCTLCLNFDDGKCTESMMDAVADRIF